MPIKFYTTVAKYEPTPEPVIPFDLTEPFYVALLDGTTATVYIPKGLTTAYHSYYTSDSTLIEYNRPTGA